MEKMIDRLVAAICRKKSPCVVGLDPDWNKIPQCYKDSTDQVACVLKWSKAVIDTLASQVVAIKPQMAFYEVYGSKGIAAFEAIVSYAQEKGLFVIDDSKRNDIGNTAAAYAFAHLDKRGPINADAMTVSPFLGMESLIPFIESAIENNKVLFVLAKTSNPGANEFQTAKASDGSSVSEKIGERIKELADKTMGEAGYGAIGAVVGATYPEEAKVLRKIMGNSFFLVPGYGAQGGNGESSINCFNEDGLGALVNSSRGILYAYTDTEISQENYLKDVLLQCENMKEDLYTALRRNFPNMKY